MADIDEIVSMAAAVHFARREPAGPDSKLDTEQVSAHWHSSGPLVLTDCTDRCPSREADSRESLP
jgi:hypothetical protein